MPKRSEIEAQIAQLQEELASADDDEQVELWVEKDGARTRLTGKHAQGWLKKLGLTDDEEPAAKPAKKAAGKKVDESEGEESEGEEPLEEEPAPVKKNWYFK